MTGTTTAVSIAAFTAEDNTRFDIASEWVKDGWRYATDGAVAARVPAEGEADAPGGNWPDGARFFATYDPALCVKPLPESPGKTLGEKCAEEHVTLGECPRCHGDGKHTCFDCEMEHDCGICGGSGEAEVEAKVHPPTCECGGTGEIQVPAPEKIDSTQFCGRRLAKIRALPNARYHLGLWEGSPLLCFVADGGVQGVLARVKPAEDVKG